MTNQYFNHDNPLDRHTLGRAELVNAIFEAVVAGFDKLPNPDLINQVAQTYADDTGAANAYVVSLPTAPQAYTAGLTITMRAANANTGASTINVDGLGAKTIKRYDGSDLLENDIRAGQLVVLGYDGTNFQLVGVHGAEVAAAQSSASAASTSASAASGSASAASGSASAASNSANSASSSATLAQNWAVKTDGPVAGGEYSAKYWAQQAAIIVGGPYLPLAGGTMTGPIVFDDGQEFPIAGTPGFILMAQGVI